jgi:hypothetical protein
MGCFAVRMKISNKNVELSEVEQAVKKFFESKDFTMEESSLGNGNRIVVSAKELSSLLVAAVKVYRDDNEITIDYFPGGEGQRSSIVQVFGSFMTIFGGGAIVLTELKRKELLEKIEDDFWKSIDSFLMSK